MDNEVPVYHSIEEVFDKLKPTYGHTFKEYDVNHRLDNPNNKGQLGHIVEEGILGYPINSNPEADLKEIGVEVKTTGLIATKKGEVRAKERLTIDSLNYMQIVDYDFEDSPMWNKADDMLFVFYKYLEDKSYGDMPIIKAVVNSFDEYDKEIIKKDYDIILAKIKAGKATEISEGDTMYLGACTAGHGELRDQPFSKLKAKNRKFCLKQSYFSKLAQKYVTETEYEHAFGIEEIRNNTMEMVIETKLEHYHGLSEDELRSKFAPNISKTAKNRYERYLAGMLEIKGKISDTDEFQKAGIVVKTIRLQENGTIKESMSFPYFKFTDIVNQEWESSDIRNMFAAAKYMFVIFKERDGILYFDRVKFWHMSENELDQYIAPVFEQLKKVISNGDIVKELVTQKNGKVVRKTNFPGMSSNPICHVRPHGRDANDVCKLPVSDKLTGEKVFTKQCFWLNNKFILSILKKDE